MVGEVDRTRYVLSERENEEIFHDLIIPLRLTGTAQDRPVVVFVAGQTGAGKTAVTNLVKNALTRNGRPVNIDLDKYKPFHPQHDELLAADDTTVGAYTSIDGHKWMEKAEAYAIRSRFHVLMESAMRDPRDFEEPTARFRAAGFRVEVAILAVHESHSRLGALNRYLEQVKDFGHGRLIDQQIHDACYRGVIRSADSIDAACLTHSVFVLNRGGDVAYRNHIDRESRWIRRPGTARAVTAERDRPRTMEETYQFAHSVRHVRTLAAGLPVSVREAAQAELRAVQNLARPLLHPDADVERITGQPATEYVSPVRAAAAVALGFPIPNRPTTTTRPTSNPPPPSQQPSVQDQNRGR